MFALHLQIPAGAKSLHVHVDFLATAPASGFSAGASTTQNLAILSWNELALSGQSGPRDNYGSAFRYHFGRLEDRDGPDG